MAAYTAAGGAIDTPITIVNAANGLMTLARPLKFVHATAAAAPGANEVTVGGGTIKMARTTDATAREAVAGDDTRLGPHLLSTATAAGTLAATVAYNHYVFTGTTTHTLTLMACATNLLVKVKNRSTGNITINRAGSDTITDASTTSIVLTPGDSIELVGNGTVWESF
jgi:hypothetical protein